MSLKEIISILKSTRSTLDIQKDYNKSNHVFRFDNLDKFRKDIYKLETTGLFENQIDYLLESALFKSNKNSIRLNLQEGNALIQFLSQFITTFDNVLYTLNSIVSDEKENSIYVKLPPTSDLEDLSRHSSEIHKIFSQVIFDEEINGKLEIVSVDNGSIWIEIYVGSVAAISLIGGMVWSASVIYKKMQEGRILENQVKSLKIRNDSFKEIQEKQALLLNHMVAAETQMLIDENYKTSKPEQVERMKHSIKLLADLIDKGAEIHPSIGEPENVKNLFPQTNSILSISSKIKKLNSGEKKTKEGDG